MRVEHDAHEVGLRRLVLPDELLGQDFAVARKLEAQHDQSRARLAQLRAQLCELRGLEVEAVLDPGQPRLHVVDAPLEAVDRATVGVDLVLQSAIAGLRCVDLALQVGPDGRSGDRARGEQAEHDREPARADLHGARR